MEDHDFSYHFLPPVIVKATKKTLVYVDYRLVLSGKKTNLIEGRGWGVANLSPDDEYNREFGIALAGLRAKVNAEKEIEKHLKKYSKKFIRKTYRYKYKQVWGCMPTHMTATEAAIKDRNKPDTYTCDVGEEIEKIEHLQDYLVVLTKTRINLFAMEDDTLIKKGEIKR